MGVIKLTRGCKAWYSVSKSLHNADLLAMGTVEVGSNMEEHEWQAEEWDEIFMVTKGRVRLLWEDTEGNRGELKANDKQYIYLPGGYKYTLKATGKPACFVWAQAPPDPNTPYARE